MTTLVEIPAADIRLVLDARHALARGKDQRWPPRGAFGLVIVLTTALVLVARPGWAEVQRVDSQHLPNCFRLTDKVYSGAQPEGDAAFAELRALGIKTLISVDGARPNMEIAKRHGLRYVHLPHGYDGIPPARLMELAKAIRELPGPIYVHCHHGKHRGPAAAASACVLVGALDSAAALGVLQKAGTSPNYRGLFQTVEQARRIDPAVLDRLQVDYREQIPPDTLTAAMVAIDHTHDNLKAIAAAGWQAPAAMPDLDPVHEALLLREHFSELGRSESVRRTPQPLGELMTVGATTAAALEKLLADRASQPAQRSSALDLVTRNCQSCHTRFRDVPLPKPQ